MNLDLVLGKGPVVLHHSLSRQVAPRHSLYLDNLGQLPFHQRVHPVVNLVHLDLQIV